MLQEERYLTGELLCKRTIQLPPPSVREDHVDVFHEQSQVLPGLGGEACFI